jgi:hypothetical protein
MATLRCCPNLSEIALKGFGHVALGATHEVVAGGLCLVIVGRTLACVASMVVGNIAAVRPTIVEIVVSFGVWWPARALGGSAWAVGRGGSIWWRGAIWRGVGRWHGWGACWWMRIGRLLGISRWGWRWSIVRWTVERRWCWVCWCRGPVWRRGLIHRRRWMIHRGPGGGT